MLHEITVKSCSVSLFSGSYNLIQDVNIATFLTAYTDEYGQTCIIVLYEVLWLGMSMDHLFINPNQIWMAVIPVSDDTFD